MVTGGVAVIGFFANICRCFFRPWPIPYAIYHYGGSVGSHFINYGECWAKGEKKWFKMGLVTFISLSLISVGIFEINQKRVENLKILTKQDVDLHYTRPIAQGPNGHSPRGIRL